jgi:hypothetical protein
MAHFKTGAFVVFLAAFSAQSVEAASISFAATTSVPLTAMEWTGRPVAFTKFDPNLGALTQVRLDFQGNVGATVLIINRLDFGYVITGHVLTAYEVRVFQEAPSSEFSVESAHFIADVGPVSGEAIPGNIEGEPWTAPHGGFLFSDPRELDAFTGLGQVDMAASASSILVIDSDSSNGAMGIEKSITSWGTLHGTVTYYYNPVPEPGSGTLFGVTWVGGVWFLGFLLRRKRLSRTA